MQNLLQIFYKSIDRVCVDWNKYHASKWGFQVEVSRKSISTAHFFVEDLLQDNPMLPINPGPFKLAAAFLVSSTYFVKFTFHRLDTKEPLNEDDSNIWKSRLLFKAIPVFLSQLTLKQTGKKLSKKWDVPTPHYRLDFLNFIRWCEFPLIGPKNPPPPNKPTVDILRVNRLVMAVNLIIETCYYLCENSINCDVMGQIAIKLDDFTESIQPDLYFDCRS